MAIDNSSMGWQSNFSGIIENYDLKQPLTLFYYIATVLYLATTAEIIKTLNHKKDTNNLHKHD